MSSSELTRHKLNKNTQYMLSFMPLPTVPIATNRTEYAAPKSKRPTPILVIDETSLELNSLMYTGVRNIMKSGLPVTPAGSLLVYTPIKHPDAITGKCMISSV